VLRQALVLPALLLCTVACGAVAPVSAPGTVVVPGGAQEAVVVRGVDGDTVVLRGTGPGALPRGPTKVRLIGVDTPEVFASAKARVVPECYGEQASARTAALLPVGARVRVAPDREREDRYGRALLYVWTTGGLLVEEDLVRGGYGRVLVVRPNDRYSAQLRAAETAARAARRGRWGACPPAAAGRRTS